MKVRVTVTVEKAVETIAEAVSTAASMKEAVKSLGTVKKWKEWVAGR